MISREARINVKLHFFFFGCVFERGGGAEKIDDKGQLPIKHAVRNLTNLLIKAHLC